jgi:hypothetical protein
VATNGNARLSRFGLGAELQCSANDSSAFNLIVQGNLVRQAPHSDTVRTHCI